MMLPVAVDRSSSDDYATHYVFTVLSMTSCFHIQIKKTMVTNSQLIRQGGGATDFVVAYIGSNLRTGGEVCYP